ncbi:MAG: SWIM zinc finger family protein [Sporocytophaga sp.]|nr:SWIM zinc finger family protein [Sporocytophaga sp.]
MSWSEEQVIALSPDIASAKSGKDLAKIEKWVSVYKNENALWGECKGSGSKPYQTQIDLNNIAFKCSCPSRKFPCKHGIGLLLLFAKTPTSFIDSESPDWVTEWLAKRAQREEKKPKSRTNPWMK